MTDRKKILVIGSSNTDMTVKGKKIPVHGETILGGDFRMGPGGKGANQAVAAARLGGDVCFVCKVGDDLFGRNAVAGYEKEGLDVSHVLKSDLPSGVALIMVDDSGENIISVAPGANSDMTVEDIGRIRPVIESADYLILQLEIPVECVVEAARIAYEAGVYVILNPAPACQLPAGLFSYVSLLVPNQTEIAILSGEKESPSEAAAVLREHGVKNLVLTLGSRGSRIYDDAGETEVPAIKVDAVDTTAAGDTFCGALCVALSEGKGMHEAVKFATSASALTVQRLGAQQSIPYRSELGE